MKKLIIGTVAVVTVALGVWVASHKINGSSAPTPLWTAQDLPASPPDGDNGFDLVQQRAVELRGTTPDALRKLLDAPTPALFEAQKEAVNATLLSPENVTRLSVLDAALDNPHLVDTCPLELAADCPIFPYLHTHDLAALRILAEASEGKPELALAKAERLLRADLEFAANGRRAAASMVGLHNAKVTVRVAKFVVDRAPAERTPALMEKLSALAKVLEEAEQRPLSMGSAVVAEYLSMSHTFATLSASAGNPPAELLYDRRDAVEQLHPYFTAVHAFAQRPGQAPKPELPRFTEQPGWWLYNPVGKKAGDILLLDLGGTVEQYETRKGELLTAAKALREQIAQVAPE